MRVDALRFLFLFLNFLAQSKMPYWHINQDLKELVLSLIDNNVVPDDFELNISKIFGVHHAIQRWQKNIDLYGSVTPPKILCKDALVFSTEIKHTNLLHFSRKHKRCILMKYWIG